MKKIALSAFVIFAFLAYAAHDKAENNSQTPVTPIPQSTDASVSGARPASAAQTQADVTAPPTPKGKYRDGTYTGNVADAYYGNVQVQVSVAGGRISDVTFLDYPHDRRTSEFINQQAMPYLKQEAIQSQSAAVDGVSGATQTSRAFRESLQTALNRAV